MKLKTSKRGYCTKEVAMFTCGRPGYPCEWHGFVETFWSLQAACV